MASSSYYYQQMNDTLNQINGFERKIDDYEDYKKKLQNLVKALPDIQNDLSKGEKSFADGGYISGGETLSRGDLKIAADTIGNCIESLNSIIYKTSIEVENMSNRIAQLRSDYENYEYAYRDALSKESN